MINLQYLCTDERGLTELSPNDFYRTIFPDGALEAENEKTGKYNGFMYVIDRKSRKAKDVVFLHDSLDELHREYNSEFDYFANGIAYAGKRAIKKLAADIYALPVDLDEIEIIDGIPVGLERLAQEFDVSIPTPTLVTSSGHGLHLWYVFSDPIHLHDRIIKILSEVKSYLTERIWMAACPSGVSIQQQSIFQKFRVVGSPTKNSDMALGFMYGAGNKISIEYLNRFLPEDKKITVYSKNRVPLSKAKEKWPDWFNRKILGKDEPQRKGKVTDRLYRVWLNKKDQVMNGHRYFFVLVLAVYATRCGISKEVLLIDAQGLSDYFSTRTPDDPLTPEDVECACGIYESKDCEMFTNGAIRQRVGFAFEHKERKSRKEHLKYARERQLEDRKENPDKYRSKKDRVVIWRHMHPNGKKSECIKDTNLSKTTVYKWWNSIGGDSSC